MSSALEKVRDEGEKGHKKQVSSFFLSFLQSKWKLQVFMVVNSEGYVSTSTKQRILKTRLINKARVNQALEEDASRETPDGLTGL